eukprot:2872142-Rhodomonas_salina.2
MRTALPVCSLRRSARSGTLDYSPWERHGPELRHGGPVIRTLRNRGFMLHWRDLVQEPHQPEPEPEPEPEPKLLGET